MFSIKAPAFKLFVLLDDEEDVLQAVKDTGAEADETGGQEGNPSGAKHQQQLAFVTIQTVLQDLHARAATAAKPVQGRDPPPPMCVFVDCDTPGA